MKKVLLSSVAALALFAAAAPAFANENPINGGANTPGAFDSREAYENQTEFVNGRKVEEFLNGHMPDIMAEAAQDPAVVAAKAELDAVEGGSHLYGEKKAAYDDYRRLRRENQELQNVKVNVDALLRIRPTQDQEKRRWQDR